MANRLSDEELRKSLQEYGQQVGPITATTRSTWERRLMTLRKANGPRPSTRALNAFSSDDSEIESAKTQKARKKRTSISRSENTKNQERQSISRSRSNSSSPDTDTFKKPSTVHIPLLSQDKKYYSSRSPLHLDHSIKTKKDSVGKNSSFDVETSDSDFDSESPLMPAKSPRLRKKPPAPNIASDFQGVNYRRQIPDVPSYKISFRRKPLNSSLNSDSGKSLPHFSPTLDRLKRESLDEGYRSNGYLSSTISNGEFHEEKVQGSSTNYSHCVSWMLVIGTVAFFVIIGALYMTEVQKTSKSVNKNYVKFCNDVKEEECKLLILISRELHQLLTTTAGEYDCDSLGMVKNRNLTVSEARSIVWKQLSMGNNYKVKEFNKSFKDSVSLLLKNPEWGIKWSFLSDIEGEADQVGMLPKNDIHFDSSALEATVADKPLWCRIRLSLQWTATTIFTIFIGAVLLFLFYCGLKLWKKKREAQEKLFYEMVEKVIDILQDQQDSSYQSDSNFKAVVNIRDTLIPPKERKAKLWLWEKVVAFIEENESRVSVEFKTIAGEDFKVWRWNPSTTPENEGGKQGKVWQGQAFNSLGKGKHATYSPAPCLKIRNMFDSEVEYGDDWQVSIQDAILEKCEGNDGIWHIAFDTSNKESCVYMLCSSSEAAGKAFNALHGWWFDNKLVTVKYIRYERYLERFPDAENCREPLRPSNNKRLSLSTPFFSSALERS